MDAALDLEERVRTSYRKSLRAHMKNGNFVGSDHTLRKYLDAQCDTVVPKVLKAVSLLLGCKVGRASLVLSGDQPMAKVRLRNRSRQFTFWPGHLLVQMLDKVGLPPTGGQFHSWLTLELEPMLETELALLNADVANAVSAALVDEEQTRGIRDQLAKRREVARLHAVEEVKNLLRQHQDVLSKDDVDQAWNEVLVARVMDS